MWISISSKSVIDMVSCDIPNTPVRYVSVVLNVGELGTSVVGQDFRKTDPATPQAFLITLNRLK